MDLSRLRAGMDRLAGAVKRTDATTPLMWGEWAVVEDPNLPSVVLESDWQQTPRPVRNAAGRLGQYQRVYVLHQGPLTTIVSNPAQEAATGWLAGTLAAGFTGGISARRVGATVEVSVVASGSLPDGSIVVGSIPAALAPSISGALTLPRLAARLSGGYAGLLNVGTSGDLTVENKTGATRTQAIARGTYLLS